MQLCIALVSIMVANRKVVLMVLPFAAVFLTGCARQEKAGSPAEASAETPTSGMKPLLFTMKIFKYIFFGHVARINILFIFCCLVLRTIFPDQLIYNLVPTLFCKISNMFKSKWYIVFIRQVWFRSWNSVPSSCVLVRLLPKHCIIILQCRRILSF